MTISALDNLDSSWKSWLNSNLEKQVPPEKLAITLFEEGFVDAAFELIKKNNKSVSKPHINTTNNNIALTDKDVFVSLTCADSAITVIENFLTPDECRRLIHLSENQNNTNDTFSSDDDKMAKLLAEKSSKTVELHQESKLVTTVEERISELVSWPTDHGDNIKITRCDKRDKYRPHIDLLSSSQPDSTLFRSKGGHCVGTVIIMLADIKNNGGTVFPSANITMRLKAGTAIYVSGFSIDTDSEFDEQAISIKDSSPVTIGVEYIATKYLKEHGYHK